MSSVVTRTVLVAITTLCTQGCSLLFVHGPPPPEERVPNQPVSCTQNRGEPTLDALMAGLWGLSTISIIASLIGASPPDDPDEGLLILIGVPVGASTATFGALSTVGAVNGFERVRECRAAKIEAPADDGTSSVRPFSTQLFPINNDFDPLSQSMTSGEGQEVKCEGDHGSVTSHAGLARPAGFQHRALEHLLTKSRRV